MKKITLSILACCMAVVSFAAGGNITYVLNGGVTNDDAWTSKEDMYQGLYASWDAFKGGGQTAWKTLAELATSTDPVAQGIPTQASTMDLTFMTDPTVAAKWQWLFDYMDAVCTAQGQTLPSSNASYLRYNLASFFVNGLRTSWPASADYAVAGNTEAFMPTWKHGFAGPATYDGSVEIVLPAPYKEGATFDGWYESADFSGEKVTAIPAGADGNKTLYAKWIEYIPTCAEVWAATAGTSTKAQGVVTLVSGTTAYIQDATAGLLVEFASAPDIAKGEKVTVSGTVAALGAYVKLTGAAVTGKESGALPSIQTVTIGSLNTDAKPYMFEYVKIEGLTITAASSSDITLSDGINSIKFAPALSLAVGTKVNVNAVVSYTTEVILTGAESDVEVAPVPRPEGVTYPALNDGKYVLTNRWLVSANMYNLAANMVGTNDYVRGMTALDGKMYFVDRENKRLVVVDGATGAKLSPVVLADNIFKYTNSEGVIGDAGTLTFNDIKKDAAGHILLGNCITSNAQPFQVWKVDLTTGQGTLVLQETLGENPDYAARTSLRFDAFNVYGNVDANGFIMAVPNDAMEAYKWNITGGVAGAGEAIIIDNSVEGTGLYGLTNVGTAPQVFPMDENYFYVDGWSILPTLINMDGEVVDGFYNCSNPDLAAYITNSNRQGHNGLVEFEIGGEYFLLAAATNTVLTPPSAFELYKFKNANKEFADLELLWQFPQAGMGAVSNPSRTAVPSVEVNQTTKTATIYLYTTNNGYGVYEFSTNGPQGIVLPKDDVNVFADGKTVKFGSTVAAAQVYNVAGQLLSTASHVNNLSLDAQGVYIVKVTLANGATVAKKVIIK